MAMSTRTAQRGAGATFRDVASQLANELVTKITQEHAREVTDMYKEVMTLRGELQRVAELMQGYLAREKQLHDMMEKLTQTYDEATRQFVSAHSQFAEKAQQTTSQHDNQRRQLQDPMRDTEQELARIQAILASPPVPPPDVPLHLHQTVMSPQGMAPMQSQVMSPTSRVRFA
mmetsp:Transcript_89077/g.191148  ORF Transcript_89077/g.191148 Transcript_89077/m.191148 type:complete len:173 (+) Transcript_89077:148-666(+)